MIAVVAASTQEELGRVPVAVETEPGTVGPAMRTVQSMALRPSSLKPLVASTRRTAEASAEERPVVGDGREGLVQGHVGEGMGGGAAGSSDACVRGRRRPASQGRSRDQRGSAKTSARRGRRPRCRPGGRHRG
ncbi:hypothetical protein MHU86_8392 [Fragilaria crotonensis]|nr:hypothetical protein MHU86_8392 [Fragilaria crotonensis]